MLENLTFSRNKHMLGRSTEDILILRADAGYHASLRRSETRIRVQHWKS